jgi:hypothetical protein
MIDVTSSFIISCIVSVALMAPWTNREATRERIRGTLERMRTDLREMPSKRRWELFFFRPIETFNTIWMVGHASLLLAATGPLIHRR